MAHDWILDVLADLKAFAKQNGLVALSEQLDDTTLIAATELASTEGDCKDTPNSNVGPSGKLYRALAERENA